MASGNTYQCNSLIEKGGVEIFLKALAKADENHEKPTLEIVIFSSIKLILVYRIRFFGL